MHSIKTDISHKADAQPLNSNASKLVKKRNFLRGMFIICSFVWLAAIGTVLYLMGNEWWPIILIILFVVPAAILGFILVKLQQVNKRIN